MAKIDLLFGEFGGKCFYCRHRVMIGAPYSVPDYALASRDHDIPKCRRGYLSGGSEVLSCVRCNHAKGDMTAVEFIAFRQTGKLAQSYLEFLEKRLVAKLKL